MPKNNNKVAESMEMEEQEEETEVGASYYVQSPSTTIISQLHATTQLSACYSNSSSSSRASNNNNIIIFQKNNNNGEMKRLISTTIDDIDINSSISINNNDGYYDYVGDHLEEGLSKNGDAGTIGYWCKYLSFTYSPSSTAWILLQLSWRFLLSLLVAFLVFYLATKPPNPNFSIKVSKVREYEVGEGVDGTGVSTKILNCNISLHLLIHNPSKLFTLHIQPPILHLSFGTLPLASSPTTNTAAGKDEEVKVESEGRKVVEVEVGSKDKLMYGGGRAMEDNVESADGLTLSIRATLRSSYHVVGSLVVPKFHHQAVCLLVLFRGAASAAAGVGGSTLPSTSTTYTGRFYDKRHRTLVYHTTCFFIPT